ncbi:MAG: N-formylglutamate deformylase [Caulobacteraceae bacterium]|nr:MAG: N-formylglutamate deformylase [Caulobacteraceae bacterium]
MRRTSWLHVRRGPAPLIVSIPHAGTTIPQEISEHLVSHPLAVHDADWFIPQLYIFAERLGATIVRTDISRTAIDVNRDPSGQSLYPGQVTTGLCPTETFDGVTLYKPGHAPRQTEISRRRISYFAPYHDVLEGEIDRLRLLHPRIVLFDAHSIRSCVERLFDGELPALNLGTNSGASADREAVAIAERHMAASGFSHVTNGRFKGGWITRHYGQPDEGVHALQMEIAQRAYMDEPTGLDLPIWNPRRAEGLQGSLEAMLSDLIDWASPKESGQ